MGGAVVAFAVALLRHQQGVAVSSTDDYIRKLVDSAPPLTLEQRDRLAVLLRPDIQPQPDEVQKPTITTTVGDIVDEV